MEDKSIKVRTIIFTEACPLDCRYCDLKNDKEFGKSPTISKEKLFEMIEQFDKEDDEEQFITRLLFSGGEPLLYWSWIEEIINKYQHRFQYGFNTSGYLFTENILKFLSNYDIYINLSVDGNEKLTNYLRPVINSPYRIGYRKQLEKIIPTLLFYFPNTPYKIIVNPRYVDLLHEMYIDATHLGFKYFSFILDFESRPDRIIDKNKELIYWNENHTKILQEQMDLILSDIITGYISNIAFPRIVELDKVIQFLLDEKEYEPNNIPCQLFSNRSLTTLYHADHLNYHCFTGTKEEFKDLKNVANALKIEYQNHSKKCSKDENCKAFSFCAFQCCPQLSYAKYKKFFEFEDLECVVNKVCYNSAIKMLHICSEYCNKNMLYNSYINSFYYTNKEEGK